ncbi:predicted protein [Streptomyces sp. C]|nr:predicted protein [Streptomyces sp. C]
MMVCEAAHVRLSICLLMLRVVRLDGVVRVEVSDGRRDRLPRPREGGYGMRIVEGVAAGWGVSGRLVGKTVWAECPLRS